MLVDCPAHWDIAGLRDSIMLYISIIVRSPTLVLSPDELWIIYSKQFQVIKLVFVWLPSVVKQRKIWLQQGLMPIYQGPIIILAI